MSAGPGLWWDRRAGAITAFFYWVIHRCFRKLPSWRVRRWPASWAYNVLHWAAWLPHYQARVDQGVRLAFYDSLKGVVEGFRDPELAKNPRWAKGYHERLP